MEENQHGAAMTNAESHKCRALVLGAGPAGLACAEALTRSGVCTRVVERHRRVGGLARTEEFQGHLFDVGPHRFFTKNTEVEAYWRRFAGDDLISVKRLTRILYNKRLLHYPLRPLDALCGLGLLRSIHASMSYAWAKSAWAGRKPANFEDWVISKFGAVLYEAFFKTYTEKVWGIPCHEIGVEWAEQRIKGLSFREVMANAFKLSSNSQVKSLVDEFSYTRRGAGVVYENIAKEIIRNGGIFHLGCQVEWVERSSDRLTRVHCRGADGTDIVLESEHVFSSIPLTELVLKLTPPADPECVTAARKLYYRDHITVNLILPRDGIFPDQWLYIHSPEVRMARVSEYGNFSMEMATADTAAVSVEYFCFVHDDIWQRSDEELIQLALSELIEVGLLASKEYAGGYVVREADSYPAYYMGHRAQFEIIKEYVSRLENFTAIGRGGMYKYNNQDHAILSGLHAARAYFGESLDLWEINTDAAYLEEKQLPSPIGASEESAEK